MKIPSEQKATRRIGFRAQITFSRSGKKTGFFRRYDVAFQIFAVAARRGGGGGILEGGGERPCGAIIEKGQHDDDDQDVSFATRAKTSFLCVHTVFPPLGVSNCGGVALYYATTRTRIQCSAWCDVGYAFGTNVEIFLVSRYGTELLSFYFPSPPPPPPPPLLLLFILLLRLLRKKGKAKREKKKKKPCKTKGPFSLFQNPSYRENRRVEKSGVTLSACSKQFLPMRTLPLYNNSILLLFQAK